MLWNLQAYASMNSSIILWIAVFIVVALLLSALGTLKRRRGGELDVPWPLESKRALLTVPEQVLYRRRVQALPHHIALAQVQLLQMVRFKRRSAPYPVLNRISQLSVDFVVLTADTGIVAAIELDDASHHHRHRESADARKAHTLRSAGIPLIRWSVSAMPDAMAISAAIESRSATN
jgi:very-short-patch-repair endonuclease